MSGTQSFIPADATGPQGRRVPMAHLSLPAANAGESSAHVLNHLIILLELRNEALSKRIACARPGPEKRLREFSSRCLGAVDDTIAAMFSVEPDTFTEWVTSGINQEKFEEITDAAGKSSTHALRAKVALALRRFALASKLL